MKKIVSFFGEHNAVFEKLNRQAEAYARAQGFSYEWAPQLPFQKEAVIRHLQQADVGIIDVEPYGEDIFREIYQSTSLLVRFGVGFDKVDLKAAAKYGIAVARTTGANAMAVAEMALTMILMTRRNVLRFRTCMETGKWEKRISHETPGSILGVLGFGSVGQLLAKLAQGIGCTVIAYDPYPNQKVAQEMGVELVTLDELFRRADSISIHVPYCPDTHHLVNAERLAMMKPDAVIVNTARGGIIEEQALCEALRKGQIAGAGLDVFAQEPLPTDSPLLGLDNVVLTPHIASQTEESLWNIYKTAIDIAVDFYQGKDSRHILNPEYKEHIGIRNK